MLIMLSTSYQSTPPKEIDGTYAYKMMQMAMIALSGSTSEAPQYPRI
jgi:hypothetical protein